MIRDFIKKVGTGPHGVRDLSRSEACESARVILSGEATPAQTGALLLGLRLKGETPEEMAGFLCALQSLSARPSPSALPDLDIGDPYDGRSRTVSLVVPAALYAARFGLRTVLHGLSRVPVKQGPGVLEGWKAHGMEPTPWPMAAETLDESRVVCLSQADFLPELARLLSLRQELGLRTIFNTVEKAVNPLGAKVQLIGIFHEPVLEKIQFACLNGKPIEPGRDSGKPFSPHRLVFVQGVEGGVDLHAHRPTMCYITDPSRGLHLSPVTIPALQDTPPASSAKEVPIERPTLDAILGTPGSPMKAPLDRQTAFFLFVSGWFNTYSEALSAVSRMPVPPSPPHRNGATGHA